jgi:cobalt/nickel transport system ATP-binding protein
MTAHELIDPVPCAAPAGDEPVDPAPCAVHVHHEPIDPAPCAVHAHDEPIDPAPCAVHAHDEPIDPAPCAVRARGLRFGYAPGADVLAGLDLVVHRGERVAVLGPNGAGKTTLMLHLNGLLRGAGELEVTGLPVARDTLPALRARVGLVFQDPDDQLFMTTVAEDVGFGPRNLGLDEREVAERTAAALDAVRMSHAAGRAPHQLSMGERRRVAIAGVLAMDPQLLVLDEPSANLDPRARRELLELLGGLDRTLLVVTHDLPFAAELCERAVILSGGRIAADGACRALLADPVLLAGHDLELPAGFNPSLVHARPRPR